MLHISIHKYVSLSQDSFSLRAFGKENDEASVKSLLQARARVEVPAGKSDPIECAARFGFLSVLKLLLAESPQSNCQTALTLAKENGHDDVERLLARGLRKRALPAEIVLDLPQNFMPGKAESGGQDIQVEEHSGKNHIRFQGSGSMTATTQTAVCLSALVDSFYFEVYVVELQLLMALGFARGADTPLATLPGWTKGTYGLHSDDGLLQVNTSPTKILPGWRIKEGSTVGMGVQWSEAAKEYQIFVTLDGQRQSKTVPLPEDREDDFELFCLVGADRPAKLQVNLGSEPFLYEDEAIIRGLERRKAGAKRPK